MKKYLTNTGDSSSIHVDFVSIPSKPWIRLGMTICPGQVQVHEQSRHRRRDMLSDLQRLRDHYKILRLVCCLEPKEIGLLEVREIRQACKRMGVELLYCPIPDGGTPDTDTLGRIHSKLPRLLESTEGNGFTAIFCKDGLGRTSLITACLLMEYEIDGAMAIRLVRASRTGAIENIKQENFVIKHKGFGKAEPYSSELNYGEPVFESAHGWANEDGSLTFDQMMQRLQAGQSGNFLKIPQGDFNKPPNSYLGTKLATSYMIEKLCKQVDGLEEFILLPFPVRIGQYRIAVHAIAARLVRSRAVQTGIAILNAPSDAAESASLKKQLLRENLLLGEGFAVEPTLQVGDEQQDKRLILVGPISERQAVELALDLGQSELIFTGTLEHAKLILVDQRDVRQI